MNAVVELKLPNTQVRRHPERGAYDRDSAYPILDAGRIAHVGFNVDDQPYVIPMLYARIGDSLYLHGSVGSRMLKHLTGGHPCCLTVTHLDGLVLARSQFSHSANYRSVAVFGRARAISDLAEKARAMRALIDALVPGRGLDARPGDAQELAGTTVLEVPIEQLSVKVRKGPPSDLDADLELPVWAGVLPLETRIGAPSQDAAQDPNIVLPDYLRAYANAIVVAET